MPKSSGKENRNQEIEKLLKELKRQVDSLQKNESARAVRPELRKLRAALRHLERLCSKGQVGDMGDVNPAGGAVPWIPSKAGESRKPLPAMVVAGDDAGFRKSIRMIFGEGFRISEARQGSQALELAMREKPSLLISGLVMSDMSGLDLWRKLRSIPALSLVPLLLLSDTEASQVAAAAGASLPESRRYSPPVNQLIARVGKIMAFQQMAHQNIPPPLLSETVDIPPLLTEDPVIGKILQTIYHSLSQPGFTVASLSETMGMSRVSLFKRVKSATGLSPQEFIRMVRITRAAQYLRESHTPIAEIAFLTGFSETRYFSRYFRDQYGMLPSHYRKSS